MLKKLLPWLLIVLVAITLIISGTFVLWNFLDKKSAAKTVNAASESVKNVEAKPLTAKQISDLTVTLPDITTNLSDRSLVKIGFAFQMSNKQAMGEFNLLTPQINDQILTALADTSPDQISGSKGLDALSTTLMNKINPLLQQGKIVHVDVTSFILPGS